MMKAVLYILLLTGIYISGYSQVPDSLRIPRDSIIYNNIPTDTLPVLADTIQYNDTTLQKTASGKDTVVVKKKVHSPRRATMRSLMIPGWGQIYNKKYWKVPIVYGAIGIPAYLFTYNRKWYNKTKYALSIVANNRFDSPAAQDSLAKVDPQLRSLVDQRREGALVDYRNEFRRDMDYAILFTILMWGLNVVDATVDGHLKGFDVSDELTIRLRPALMANTLSPGLSVVVAFK